MTVFLLITVMKLLIQYLTLYPTITLSAVFDLHICNRSWNLGIFKFNQTVQPKSFCDSMVLYLHFPFCLHWWFIRLRKFLLALRYSKLIIFQRYSKQTIFQEISVSSLSQNIMDIPWTSNSFWMQKYFKELPLCSVLMAGFPISREGSRNIENLNFDLKCLSIYLIDRQITCLSHSKFSSFFLIHNFL